MRRSSEFWELMFSLREGAALTLLGVFVLGVLVMGLLSNLLYGLLTDVGGVGWGMVGRVALACGALVALAYGLYAWERRRWKRIHVVLDESRLAPPHRGLIWLLGPGPVEHALCAIRHHARGQPGQRLEHCWVVMERGNPAVQAAYHALAAQVDQEGLDVRIEPTLVDSLDVEAAYSAVRRIFEQEAAVEGLAESDLVADITGATKPMTAGMVLAALDNARDLEYVESQRDEKGAPIPGTLQVVRVAKSFRLDAGQGAA